jgi:hypothetical protein
MAAGGVVEQLRFIAHNPDIRLIEAGNLHGAAVQFRPLRRLHPRLILDQPRLVGRKHQRLPWHAERPGHAVENLGGDFHVGVFDQPQMPFADAHLVKRTNFASPASPDFGEGV